ncbi:hypothetical protein DSECCO2_561160 [anaerobic digester metagenome]
MVTIFHRSERSVEYGIVVTCRISCNLSATTIPYPLCVRTMGYRCVCHNIPSFGVVIDIKEKCFDVEYGIVVT